MTFSVEEDIPVVAVFYLKKVGNNRVALIKRIVGPNDCRDPGNSSPARDFAKLRCARANLAVEESPYVDLKWSNSVT